MASNWAKLEARKAAARSQKILELFAADENRAQHFSVELGEMLFDFSKTTIDAAAFAELIELAESADLAAKRDAMFSGAQINDTEHRAVLHTALRNLDGSVLVDGE
ncbi:MAG: glucose-6-phosphate isomerase, partial [Mangrovicoccus sp.]